MSRSAVGLPFAIAASLSVLLGPSAAETVRLTRLGPLEEAISDRVQTSGSLLAGLHLGPSGGSLDQSRLQVRIRPALRGEQLCFRLASRDGRYRGVASYSIPGDSSLSPLLQFDSQYLDRQTRPASDYAARAIRSATCHDGSSGPLVPTRLSNVGDRGRMLTALVNPGDARVTARLTTAAGSTVEGQPCRRFTTGASIVFSHACEIALPADVPSGPATLVLGLIELTGDRSAVQFEVEVPATE